jgi:phosphoglucosamine mutase
VLQEKADLGIALDGDGDRVVIVDHEGNILDGDEILYIIVKHRHEAGLLKGGVVGTVMTNFGFEQALQDLNIEFVRVPVGDRYIMAELAKRHWHIGGEASGHIICSDAITTGDGVITALQVLSVIKQTKRTLADLKKGLHKYPQILVNVKVTETTDPLHNPRIHDALTGIEKNLGQTGRVLLRRSGTEPLVRVMVEGKDESHVTKLANQLAEVVKEEMAR